MGMTVRAQTMGQLSKIGLLFIVALLACCTVSPMPLPPSVEPPELSVEKVYTESCLACDQPDVIFFNGPPGTVSHPDYDSGIIVWVADLNRPVPPAITIAGEDGSFTVSLDYRANHTYRIQTRILDQRSEPIDVRRAGVGLPVEVVTPPLADCFFTEPALELDFGIAQAGTVETIELINECDHDVVVGSVRMHIPTEDFETDRSPAEPERLAPQAHSFVEIEFLGTASRTHEALVLIEVGEPTSDLRAINLFARGP